MTEPLPDTYVSSTGKPVHEFSLVVDGLDLTDLDGDYASLETAVFDALPDASVAIEARRVLVQFAREADSFSVAVTSARTDLAALGYAGVLERDRVASAD